MDEIYKIKNKLRELGYDAKIVNANSFDIHQNGYIHYLSENEAMSLAESNLDHPINLMDYATKNGLNYWYTFK